MGRRFRSVIIAAVVFVSACTVQRTPAPPLQGPSELALSLTILANPDVLSQDGASQSQLIVQARDANGLPAASVPFRAEITVGGVAADYGSLSARTLVTGSDGRATFTYTAPPAPLVSVDTNSWVTIRVTPSGSDYANAMPRSVEIRLVPPGVILPPAATPTAAFTFSPTTPAALTNVVFDASTSTPADAIVSYSWNFGDGSTGTGITVTHQFARPNTYAVTLTVANSNGVSKSITQPVAVGAGSQPTANFVFSPSSPTTNQDIFFNASLSTAGTGRTLVRYDWNFGSGTPQTGVLVTKAYDVAGTYNVVLTVTDDAGQTATRTQSVAVTAAQPGQGLTASFTFSPTTPSVTQTVNFNASGSTTPSGTLVTSYAWDFGDGGTASGSTATTSHAFGAAGTYVVRLTIANSASQTATTTRDVVVTAGGVALTADFTFSPISPVSGGLVNFNANTSSPLSTITRFDWDFGDGTSMLNSGVSVNHTYTTSATLTYTVRLTVYDNTTPTPRTATTTKTVPVTAAVAPIALFTVSASPATVNVPVTFDGTPSTATAPATIARYTWNFGDGSSIQSTTAPLATITHTYTSSNTYTITLTVTDSNGRTGSTSQTLLVQP